MAWRLTTSLPTEDQSPEPLRGPCRQAMLQQFVAANGLTMTFYAVQALIQVFPLWDWKAEIRGALTDQWLVNELIRYLENRS